MTRLDQKNEALILFTWLTVCFTCDWLQENTTFIIYETMLRPNRGQHVVNHAVNTMKCMHIIFYPAYIKDLITLPKTVFSEELIYCHCAGLLPLLMVFPVSVTPPIAQNIMPIVSGHLLPVQQSS